VICVIGPSAPGSRPCSLHQCLVRSQRLDLVEGQEVNDAKLESSRAPQGRHGVPAYNLFPHRTALANIMMRRSTCSAQRAESRRGARPDRKVRLDGARRILSGRAVGRPAATRRHCAQLAMQPDVMLFDEVRRRLDPEP